LCINAVSDFIGVSIGCSTGFSIGVATDSTIGYGITVCSRIGTENAKGTTDEGT